MKGSEYDVLTQWIVDHKIGAVVCDFSPLRIPKNVLEQVKKKIKEDVPLVLVNLYYFFRQYLNQVEFADYITKTLSQMFVVSLCTKSYIALLFSIPIKLMRVHYF